VVRPARDPTYLFVLQLQKVRLQNVPHVRGTSGGKLLRCGLAVSPRTLLATHARGTFCNISTHSLSVTHARAAAEADDFLTLAKTYVPRVDDDNSRESEIISRVPSE